MKTVIIWAIFLLESCEAQYENHNATLVLNSRHFLDSFYNKKIMQPNAQTLIISQVDVKNIPRFYFNFWTQNLYVQKLNIETIHEGAFSSCSMRNRSELCETQFESIYLQGNKLKIISEGVFGKLDNLKILHLDYNKIQAINSKAFQNQNLTQLYLNHNSLTNLPHDLCYSLRKLKILDISNNKIECIDSTLFNFTLELKSLNVSHNLLTKLDYVAHLQNLVALNVSWNKINEQQLNSITQLHTIIYLDLKGNKLKDLSENSVLSNLTNLRYLDICDNNIKHEVIFSLLTKHVRICNSIVFSNNNIQHNVNNFNLEAIWYSVIAAALIIAVVGIVFALYKCILRRNPNIIILTSK